MTFEEYKQAMSKLDFTVKRGDLNNNYVYVSDDEGQSLIVFNAMEHTYLNKIEGKALDKLSINEITYLLNNTKEFLKTNFRDKHLQPIYHLVWESNNAIDYLVGYDFETGTWKIATDVALKNWDYQYEFTDDQLEYIANGDKELLNKLNFLKEKI